MADLFKNEWVDLVTKFNRMRQVVDQIEKQTVLAHTQTVHLEAENAAVQRYIKKNC